MRLFLSSYGISEHVDTLRRLAGGNQKLLFIDNAKDYLPAPVRAQHVDEKKADYEALGFDFEELDLREYFPEGKAPELRQRLEGAGIVYVSGGNTFIVRRALRYSGLDIMLQDLLERDRFVYAGSSAGSILATPSLRGTEYGDDPHDIPAGYQSDIIWEGLHFIDDYLIPHFESEWDEEMAQGARDMMTYFEREHMPYVPLRDGQVYVVDGAKHEVLT